MSKQLCVYKYYVVERKSGRKTRRVTPDGGPGRVGARPGRGRLPPKQ